MEEKNLAETLNTFTKLEPLKALIFSNSPWGENQDILCSRDNFWRNSLHGVNRHNVDMYGLKFDLVDEIIYYVKSMSLYCVERNGKYVNFHPVPLNEYFSSETMRGEYFDGNKYQEIFVHSQQGQTDSERILLFIINRVNEEQKRLNRPLLQSERFRLIDEIVCKITPEKCLGHISFVAFYYVLALTGMQQRIKILTMRIIRITIQLNKQEGVMP